MNAAEAALLCRYVAACCPQQRFDEFTPDAWFDLLGDLPLDLAKRAAASVAKRQPFVAPSEIRADLRMLRDGVRPAIAQQVEQTAGHWDPDGNEDFRDWQRRHIATAARLTDDAIRAGVTAEIGPWADEDRGHIQSARAASLVSGVVEALPRIEAW